VTTPASNAGPGGHGFDPEAEQEVDFAKYGRMLATRWWLLAAGLVAGAVIGYLVSLGGTQVYSATATLYLGQPLSASGNAQLQTLQTNPTAVGTLAHSQQIDGSVAAKCNATSSEFRKGISTAAVSGYLSKNGQSPLVQLTVQAKKAKIAQCTANRLAKAVVTKLGTYAYGKIEIYKAQIAADNKDISTFQAAIANPGISPTDKLILETTLRSDQQDKISATGFLLQASQVEAPHIASGAAAVKTTARTRRNTVVIAALIGLILGALAALLWDRVVPGLTPRNGNGV
jgi:capsular polysaccharide biosynthesis protein